MDFLDDIKKEKEDKLSKIAMLYPSVSGGPESGANCFISIDDAKKICGGTGSRVRGPSKPFYWVPSQTIFQNYSASEKVANFAYFLDDGRLDARLKKMGIDKIDPDEVFSLFEDLGYKVVRPKKYFTHTNKRNKNGNL
jgi:hypothetical protein